MTWAMYFDWYLKSLIVSAVSLVVLFAMAFLATYLNQRR